MGVDIRPETSLMSRTTLSYQDATGAGRYSADRCSLAQEIAEALRTRGYWVPKDYIGPDLITAVCKALDGKRPKRSRSSFLEDKDGSDSPQTEEPLQP